MSTNRNTLEQQIENAREEIRQRENKVKKLLQQQKDEDRKARTKRLIERGAILESESVNCHCIHRGIVNENILGLPLDERKRMQEEAVAADNVEFQRETNEKILTNPAGNGIINIDDIKAQIETMPKNIREGQQNKHISGTHEYNQYADSRRVKSEYGPSRLNGDIEFAQRLVDKYSGTGEIIVKNGKWLNYEKIRSENTIGVAVNNLNGAEAETTRFKIHYSKYGTHIVPDYPDKKESE